ncbi:MAG: hypothetical protein A2096_16690 [Spirochaetes bacterium GWF1_41_5]|nr:MAG: hypothetical protein A2096_16690 [Spirochaetes bacterium GWF1_41_5]HBE03210.1 hypothetical protein [Spirochaetia bacterium]
MKKKDLEFYTKRALTWLMVISISAIFIFAMVVWDTGVKTGNEAKIIAKINNRPVYWSKDSDFVRIYQNTLRQYKEYGYEISDELSRYLMNQALNRVALDQLMYDYALKNKIRIADEEIIAKIRQYFYKDGVFDEEAFRRFKYSENAKTKKQYEEQEQKEITSSYLKYDLLGFAPVTSSELFERLLNKNRKKRVMILYYNAEKDLENYRFSENELQEYFRRNITRYQKIKVSYFSADDQKEAETIYSRLKKNPAEFNNLLAGDSENSFTGTISAAGPDRELALQAFAAQSNSILSPVKSGQTWRIARVESAAAIPDFNELKTSVEIDYVNESSRIIIEKLKAEKKDMMSSILSHPQANALFSQYGGKNNFELYSTGFFSYFEKEIFSGKTKVAFADREFISKVFQVPAGGRSGIIELENGLALAAVLEEKIPDQQKFQPDQEEIQQTLKELKTEKTERLSMAFSSFMLDNGRIKSYINKYFGQQ